ncbi:MAG TPA: hypothetical protein P5282_09200 [Anaerolineaceae bacterium]|nr:hypothetical protein [Anaerolineaceae bacterium]
MATIGKRKSTAKRRKSGAPKRKKARVGAAKASPATVTVNGKRYTKKMCSLTKPEAQKKAKLHRERGAAKFALVRKNTAGKGYCLYARG